MPCGGTLQKVSARHKRPSDSRFCSNEMKRNSEVRFQKRSPGEKLRPVFLLQKSLFQPHSMNGIFFGCFHRLKADRDQRNE